MDRTLQHTSRIAARIGGWLLFVAALAITGEVTLRKIFVISLSGANEISGYAFAVGGSWAAALALFTRANIRIDVLYQFLPSRGRALLDILAHIALLGFLGFLSWRVSLVLADSFVLGAKSNTPLGVPLWIPQGLWFLGMAAAVFVGIFLLVQSTSAFRRGELRVVSARIGMSGAEEELKEAGFQTGDETKTAKRVSP